MNRLIDEIRDEIRIIVRGSSWPVKGGMGIV
jgi:hypothetical protein